MPRETDPTARQWLAADLGARTVRLVVAGVSGGVGATTLAALVARTVVQARPGHVRLVDHTGGTLAERAGDAPGGQGWAGPDQAQVSVECVGASALLPGATAARAAGVVPVVVAPWHPAGLQLADRAAAGLPGALVVAVDTTRSNSRRRHTPTPHGLSYDAALTIPGPVRDGSLSPSATDAVLRIAVAALTPVRAAAPY